MHLLYQLYSFYLPHFHQLKYFIYLNYLYYT
nr:MAG TPA: hypothetical protein [Caudoviricetes sp.]